MSNGRPWSPEDSQTLRRLVQAGLTNQQIGERMDRHRNTIRNQMLVLGLVSGQSPILSAMMMRIRYRRRMAQGRAV